MSKNNVPILYIKSGCPWCREANSFFSRHGVTLDIRDVNQSKKDLQRMIEVSGQALTPTFEFGEFIVADFSIDEFKDALSQVPEIRRELGFGDSEEWD